LIPNKSRLLHEPGEFFDELIKDDGAPVDSIFLTNLFIIVTIGLITFYMTDG